ncbi:ChaN family lipoprotein [Anaeromyxobacter terrae]|uniref:ChaN family lipoprotein n=1 Tax=Anaeromyxobacter terrae TaxID=2925406 RepID=UPI001F5A3729|nr:ChaN family lipoprotein [Anaeromyxobacter sp. SG22]
MSPNRVVAASALALLSAACASRPNPKLVQEPISTERTWVSERLRDHPLVGKIWDARAGRLVDEATLTSAVDGADLVMLGEMHDNLDHHLLQARLVRAIGAAGKRPALAFEMMEEDDQPAIDAAIARAPRDPDAIARAVDWNHSGWYDFATYRPIFAAGLEAGMPIVGANLPVPLAKAIAMKGSEALTPELRGALEKEEPLPPEVVTSLRAEMKAAHCDAPMPDPILDRLALAQRARDAQMARRLSAAGEAAGGAILVTGNGHARTDRGVPAALARERPGRRVVSVGLFEVSPGKLDPALYAAEFGTGPLPFDFVVFTPAAEREDPCLALRGHDFTKHKAP